MRLERQPDGHKALDMGPRPAHRLSRWWGASLGFAVALTSGCATVGPDFATPEADTAESWVDEADPRVKAEATEQREWWKTFNDPTLDTLIQRAYEQNLPLKIAGLRVHEARAILGVAVGNLYPQSQSASGSYTAVELSDNAEPVANLPGAVADTIDTSFQTYRLGFDAAWELDFWGRFRRSVESADATLASTIASYDDLLVTLTGEVAAAYLLLRTLDERLTFARKNVAIQERSLEITQVRFRNGLTTELDVQLARALLRDTQASVPLLESGVRRSRYALSLLLGLPPSDLQDILGESGVIPMTPTEVAVGIPADLLRRRPDIRRAELRAAAQSARIGVAKADLYPAFRLIGSVGYAADSTGDLFNSDSFAGIGAFGLVWKFLNYGRLRNAVRVEDARFQQLVVEYQNTVLTAAREVEDGLTRFLTAQERVGFLTDGVAASERAVELSLVQYRDGVADYTRVLDSQQFLVLQQDRLTETRGQVAQNLVAVYKALGGGWQLREGNDFIPDEMKDTMRERSNWGDLLETQAVQPVPTEERGTWRGPDR